LRVPDALTQDKLIEDKRKEGGWSEHEARGDSWFVSASAWALAYSPVSFAGAGHLHQYRRCRRQCEPDRHGRRLTVYFVSFRSFLRRATHQLFQKAEHQRGDAFNQEIVSWTLPLLLP
jgi:proline dehydrogenase